MRADFRQLMHSARFRRISILAHDAILVSSAFPIAILLKENFAPTYEQALQAIYGSILLFGVAATSFQAMRVQQAMWRYSSLQDLVHLAKALIVVTVIFFPLLLFVDRLAETARSSLLIFWFVAFAGLCGSRLSYFWAIHLYAKLIHTRSGNPPCRVLVLAALKSSSATIQTLKTMYGYDVDLIGIVGPDGERGRVQQGVKILGDVGDLVEILATLETAGRCPDFIVLGDHGLQGQDYLYQDARCAAPDAAVVKSSELGSLTKFIEDRLHSNRLFPAQIEPNRFVVAKRLIDLAVSSMTLFFLVPLLAIIATSLYLFHGSPVIFSQLRAGRQLHDFQLLKFRTMKPPLDASGCILKDCERITGIGQFLRRTRLDELPQLWNVLLGDMSLIGPRPLLRRDMPNDPAILAERYSIRPGITGWAQVNGGIKITNKEKMYLDIFYIRNISSCLEIRIILLTLKMMIFGEKIDHKAINYAIHNVDMKYLSNL